MMRPIVFLARSAAFGATLLASATSLALVQPDGTPIPVTGQLQALFDAAADPIDAINDAADVPETFSPKCNLTFTLISRGGAAFMNVFGWYNVTGSAPQLSDLHVLLDCTAQPGQPNAVATLDIQNDPAYLGGDVGFFLITPENQASYCASTSNVGYVYYSEKGFNPDNTGPSSYIHLIIYDSKSIANAFYFAWEDLFGGGDNEFTDFVSRVDGITCANGGADCDTGQLGICAAGTMQCQSGSLACVPSSQPGIEACNGLDDDCNGEIDDGDICPAGQVCDKGTCVPQCGSGEFTCASGLVCNPDGYCVDPACEDVTCPSGERCVAGDCVAPCDGVVCPHDQVCRVGVCVDPCANLTCDTGQVCTDGACKDACQCAGCPAGETCEADGRCVPAPCDGVNCGAGEYCADDGNCTDACAGAVCPAGQTCQQGMCVDSSSASTGTNGSTGAFTGAGGGSGAGGSSGAGNGATSGAGGDFGGDDAAGDSGGCGCRTGATGDATALAAALLAALGLTRRRRRDG